jgi:hypothetical protein
VTGVPEHPQDDITGDTWLDDLARASLEAFSRKNGRDGIFVRPRSYQVSVWPDDMEGEDSETWSCTVDYRGEGKWAVLQGAATGLFCLSADGTWDWEMRPSDRTDEWLAAHRFSHAVAMRLAREQAPQVKINGLTALEVLARHRSREDEPPGAGG